MHALNRSTVTLALSLVAAISLAQAQPKPGPWFTSKEVAPGVLRIEDHGSDNMYLVLGRSKALLVDTGLGVGRLADFLKTLTALPLVVVNTHGHPDHAGGNNEFKTVYAHPAEFEAIRVFGTKESRQNTIARMTRGAPAADTMSVDDAMRLPPAELVPIRDGHVFDLGGRELEVIEQPGHTPGEIVLLDAARRLVLTGDNDNGLVWLFLPNCLPLEVYGGSLKKLQARSGEFDTLLPGHGEPLPKTFIADQIACVGTILDGTCRDEPYQSFAGNGRVCKCANAAIAFNPANLRAKK
jgi:glyoxylase-like metal-dependent hydrolase (beta-lactamase superfamily II)